MSVSVKVAIATNMWPYPERPAFGTFVRDQAASLERVPEIKTTVVPLLPIDSRSRYLHGRDAFRRIIDANPDVVHCHHPFTLIALGRFLTKTTIPTVLTIHGIEGTHGWRRYVTRWTLRYVDELVVTNENLRERYGGHLIPCGVDTARFAPARSRPHGQLRVITVGEDRPEKRLSLAKDAVQWVQTQPSVPPFDHEFVSNVPPEQMPSVYAGSDLLLLSSKAEGAPMVVQEALACGLRVVTTDVGDLSTLYDATDGVHVAKTDDVESLGEALIAALAAIEDNEPLEAKVQNLETTAEALRSVYRALVT